MSLATRIRTMALASARTLRVSGPTVLEALAGRLRREDCDDRLSWWSRTLLEDIGVKIEARGTENITPWEPMVVMSNHQSLYDIPVLYQTLPRSVRMVSKKEIFYIPVFGQAMRAAEFIEVDRGNRARAIKNLQSARSLVASGISVWIAPEGTRSADGHLGAFKKGGFVLAEETSVAILPISIDGTHHILPARTTDLQLGRTVRVTVHPRVRREEVQSRDAWITRVRDAIANGLSNP